MLKVGDQFPDFKLPDQSGQIHKLSDYSGKWLFIYFYPKDDTPGCTVEACSVRDNIARIQSQGVTVLGVSTDPVKSHKKFEQKYQLNFTLLSDEDKKLVNDVGVWEEKKFMGKSYMGTQRTSFIVDPQGKVVKVYEKVNPKGHVDQVLIDLKTMIH